MVDWEGFKAARAALAGTTSPTAAREQVSADITGHLSVQLDGCCCVDSANYSGISQMCSLRQHGQ